MPDRKSLGPGPGAYSPHDEPLSQVRTAPSYNMGANLRTDFTALKDKEVPGPGMLPRLTKQEVQQGH
jgi:hypothetical protein